MHPEQTHGPDRPDPGGGAGTSGRPDPAAGPAPAALGVGRPPSFFDTVGGEETFRRLVARFYERVAADPVLRPLYPEADLRGAEERLRLFLIQYWGGPATYSDRRGHPRLRMRHAPFAIGPAERQAWLTHMTAAVRSLELPPLQELQLLSYFQAASKAMINTA